MSNEDDQNRTTDDAPPEADATPDTDAADPEPTEVADAPASEPTEPTPTEPAATEPSGATDGSTPAWRRSLQVPVWVLAAVVVVAVGALSFGIGRWTAPDDASSRAEPEITVDRDEIPIPELPDDPDQLPLPESGPILGVRVDDATDPDGAEVVGVLEDGPAADAGLEEGDVITAVDDDSVTSSDDLVDAIGDHDVGDEITITFTRSEESNAVEVTLTDVSDFDSSNPAS